MAEKHEKDLILSHEEIEEIDGLLWFSSEGVSIDVKFGEVVFPDGAKVTFTVKKKADAEEALAYAVLTDRNGKELDAEIQNKVIAGSWELENRGGAEYIVMIRDWNGIADRLEREKGTDHENPFALGSRLWRVDPFSHDIEEWSVAGFRTDRETDCIIVEDAEGKQEEADIVYIDRCKWFTTRKSAENRLKEWRKEEEDER